MNTISTTMTQKTILIALLASPYHSDSTTTFFRVTQAALSQGHHVIVWACKGATTLTIETLGASKPRNFLNMQGEYPSTVTLIQSLLAQHTDHLQWYICRHCMEERGATNQIKHVKIKPPFKFLDYCNQSDVCLTISPP